MSKPTRPDQDLTDKEIEEELINNDLMSSGGVDSQAALQQMDLEEKKNLLHCINQSKEDFHQEASQASSSSRPSSKPIIINTSSAEFPSLAAAAKANKLKLPRRLSSTQNPNREDHCITLVDDDDIFSTKPKKFNLPFCVSDNAPPLAMPNRALRREECPYYQMKGESGKDALRRMLAHHDSWKEKYNAEMRKLESQALGESIEQDIDDKEQKSEENGRGESDPYTFTEVTKTNSGPGTKKRESKKSLDSPLPQNSRTLQRRASRDSDCEEVQPILKPDEPKLSEWLTAVRPKSKRNRKQNSNQARTQSQTDIEFGFDNSRSLWGAGRSGGGAQAPAPARRSLPMGMGSVAEVQEEKVQCPICQRNFTLSTVENHAATCEGFSSSPMDIEEGP